MRVRTSLFCLCPAYPESPLQTLSLEMRSRLKSLLPTLSGFGRGQSKPTTAHHPSSIACNSHCVTPDTPSLQLMADIDNQPHSAFRQDNTRRLRSSIAICIDLRTTEMRTSIGYRPHHMPESLVGRARPFTAPTSRTQERETSNPFEF